MASEWIVSDPRILGGKPCIRGTRLSVEFILELLASGATQEQVLATYPQIAPDALGEALRFAARSLRGDSVWDVKVTA